MSASTMPTLRPGLAIATARLTVTEDLPTPPLPEAIAKTLVSEPGLGERDLPLRLAAAQDLLQAGPLLLGHHAERRRRTSVTPGTLPTAAVTSRVMVSFSGQPATVSRTFTVDRAVVGDLDRRRPCRAR